MQTKEESNIYLVAAYLSAGGKLSPTGIDRSNPKHIKFTIEGEELDEIETGWFNGSVTGNLVEYHEQIRKVKGLLYAR
jgi:hypothetical protein